MYQTECTKLVEPNFPLNYNFASQQLSDFFTYTQIKASTSKVDSLTIHIVVHCLSLPGLINRVISTRKASSDLIIKLRIDGGKGFLKACFSVVEKSPFQGHGRLLKQRVPKETSVKRQLRVTFYKDFLRCMLMSNTFGHSLMLML